MGPRPQNNTLSDIDVSQIANTLYLDSYKHVGNVVAGQEIDMKVWENKKYEKWTYKLGSGCKDYEFVSYDYRADGLIGMVFNSGFRHLKLNVPKTSLPGDKCEIYFDSKHYGKKQFLVNVVE